MIGKRRKGVALVDSSDGIVLVAGKDKKFTLPGGEAERWETRKKAAIRELYEETGLKTKKVDYLFSYVGGKWYDNKGKIVRNHAKVFLIKTEGKPRPRHEIKYVAFWELGKNLDVSNRTLKIIKEYLKHYKK